VLKNVRYKIIDIYIYIINVCYCWLINTELQIHGIFNTLIRWEGNIKMDFKEKLWKGWI